jgi:hypothetical protein
MKNKFRSRLVIGLVVLSSLAITFSTHGRQDDQGQSSAEIARQLSNTNATVRQKAAEDLARLVALDQKKLVEGYLLQEKDKRVKLALNWAIYRMGKSSVLFEIVRELDSGRHDQAVDYLSQLESVDALYVFLSQEKPRPKVVVGIIEVLGRIGDSNSLQQIKPFVDSFDPRIAEAAKSSSVSIQQRLDEPATVTKTRPRTITP